MMPLFGHTRSVVRRNYALLEPSGFVDSPAREWRNTRACVVISPAIGARFSQVHLSFDVNGAGEGETGDGEFCAYVVRGKGRVRLAQDNAPLSAGSFVYAPPATSWSIRANRGCEIVIFSRKYVRAPGVERPASRIGHAKNVPGKPFLDDPDARLKVLLPDESAFDMAVNIFTFQPGATLPMVETHIMEHGLVMLSGQGVYRLGDDWHPVGAGDVIWMGPYCPQWFVAMGKEPASYLYYKDVNRPPL
jgi:(S)-ureidoglycine aminohydrolase